jgi:hypothetical protein
MMGGTVMSLFNGFPMTSGLTPIVCEWIVVSSNIANANTTQRILKWRMGTCIVGNLLNYHKRCIPIPTATSISDE